MAAEPREGEVEEGERERTEGESESGRDAAEGCAGRVATVASGSEWEELFSNLIKVRLNDEGDNEFGYLYI